MSNLIPNDVEQMHSVPRSTGTRCAWIRLLAKFSRFSDSLPRTYTESLQKRYLRDSGVDVYTDRRYAYACPLPILLSCCVALAS